MATISSLKSSRFLKKDDVGEKGKVLTIESVKESNVAGDGQPEDVKWVVYFAEDGVKPMVLNSTNGQLIADIAKDEEMDNWAGTKIVAYNDPSIFFSGKRVGGIRVRAPRLNPNAAKPQAAVVKDDKGSGPEPERDWDKLGKDAEAALADPNEPNENEDLI